MLIVDPGFDTRAQSIPSIAPNSQQVAEPPEALDRYFGAEEARWRKVIEDAGIKIE